MGLLRNPGEHRLKNTDLDSVALKALSMAVAPFIVMSLFYSDVNDDKIVLEFYVF